MKFHSLVIALTLFSSSCVSISPAKMTSSLVATACAQDASKQKSRSDELQTIASADQADRQGPPESLNWIKVTANDEARRKRVGEIFGEGCINSAADYSAAALIFQHGNTPDHYFQAFLWAKKALDLGNTWEGHSVANGIDRYLVNVGHKQIFGTQFSQEAGTRLWCLEPVEKTFPESFRVKYLKTNLQDSIQLFLTFYKSTQRADQIPTCDHERKPSPAGTVPGFW